MRLLVSFWIALAAGGLAYAALVLGHGGDDALVVGVAVFGLVFGAILLVDRRLQGG